MEDDIQHLAEVIEELQHALQERYGTVLGKQALEDAITHLSQQHQAQAKGMLPIYAQQQGILKTMATWTRVMQTHRCGQAYVEETNGTEHRYFDVEPVERQLCVECGLPYENTVGGTPPYYTQYKTPCPNCSTVYTTTEYKGERSFSHKGKRVYWCIDCALLFDRATTPAMFLALYKKDHVDPQMSEKMFTARTNAWKDDMDATCQRASDSIYTIGTININKAEHHTTIHIHEENEEDATPKSVKVELDDGEYDWSTWQQDLSTTYTPEGLVEKIQQMRTGESIQAHYTTAVTNDKEAIRLEYQATEHVLTSLTTNKIRMDDAIQQLYTIADEARRHGSNANIAIERAQMLEAM